MFFALLVLFTTSSPLTPHLITEELRQLIKKIQQTSQNREVGYFFFLLSFSHLLYLFILFSEIFRNKQRIKGRYQCILAKGQRLEIHVSSVSEAMQRAGRERERREEKKIFPPSSLFILINIGILC